MDLNVQDWKDFKLSSIMTITNGKGITDNEIIENIGTLPAIQGGESDNGILGYIDESYCKENNYPIINENCLTVARVGTAGFVSFHDRCVVGDKAKALTFIDKSIASVAKYMFMCSVLNQNRYKYSYGRGLVTDVYMSEILKLPIQHNPDGTPIIDADKTYSDEGYIPDWQFMEDYIKSLHSEPITTTRGVAAESLLLGVEKWKEFKLSDVFIAETGNTDITQELLTDDGEIVVSAGEGNTGVIGRCSVEAKIFPQNTITLDMFGFAFPRPYKYKMVTHARIFSLSVKEHIMSRKQSIFMATMLNNSGYKYAYGRMCSWERVKNDTVSLPIQRDASGNPVIDPDKKYSDKGYIPDWDFMERYIDSLPYSDKIA